MIQSPTQQQESFLYGTAHIQAFQHFEGISRHISYDPPATELSKGKHLTGYRWIRDVLSTRIALEFRFPARMLNVVAQCK